MRKVAPETLATQLSASEELELARIVPIRTETTLTRYPIHRIAKKGTVRIKQTKQNEKGKVFTVWEVKNPPGPLAYKLDTIIINRRIDEMRNRGEIRRLIKLGSLRDICEELGINPNGKATNSIKEALKENAFAGISTKLNFTGNDGTERVFEFATTRYTVIFTGETLPSGKRADGVYIELHPRYHEMLNHAKTRPLDYEYLKELPPSAQRLYELLSFTIFGTLRHGRPTAQMLYSEFCQSAPLTRYKDWERVRPQMWKIHKPHIDAGYIKSVDFEETADANGVTDWLMKYVPGKKARHEFREFTAKRVEGRATRPQLLEAVKQENKRSIKQANKLSSEQEGLLAGLRVLSVGEEKAQELVESYPDRVERELESFPHRDRAKMKDPAAWLIRAIEKGDYSQPARLEEKRRARAAESAKKRREEADAKYRPRYLSEYLQPFALHLPKLSPEAFAIYTERCTRMDQYLTQLDGAQRERFKLWDLEEMAKDWPELELLGFDAWLEENHPEALAG
jgi:hypothetical protein